MLNDPVAMEWLINAMVFVLMFALGLEVTREAVASIYRHPRALATGLGIQMLLLPGMAFVWAITYAEQEVVALGLLLIAACPGGPVSNVINYIARADAVLSVNLTIISSLMSFVTLPLIFSLGLAVLGEADLTDLSVPAGAIVPQLFLTLIVPMGLGMAVRELSPRWRGRLQRPMERLARIMFIVVIIAALRSERAQAQDMIEAALPPALGLTMSALLGAYAVTWLVRLEPRQRFTVATETALHNLALASMIAQSTLGRPELLVFVGAYAVAGWIPILPWMLWFRWRLARLPPASGRAGRAVPSAPEGR